MPADASAAAFWLVAGAAHPDAELHWSRGRGRTRGDARALDILREMGARIEESRSTRLRSGERRAAWRTSGSVVEPARRSMSTHAARSRRSTRSRSSASRPTQARGVTTFRGVGELRVKESDRIAGIVAGLTAFGAKVSVEGDDVRIVGPTALEGASVDGQGDHRLVMTFAIAGLLASGRTSINGAGECGHLRSRLHRRARKDPTMTKRVVLIGHPVAHSLSGAMQQAALDAAGIDAAYELWDRAPLALPGAIEELREDAFLGANITIPHKERVVPLVDRLTEEAQATGAVNTITARVAGSSATTPMSPGFDVALDRLVGRQKMPQAGGPARRGRRGAGRDLRPDPRPASSGSSSSTATSTGRRRW